MINSCEGRRRTDQIRWDKFDAEILVGSYAAQQQRTEPVPDPQLGDLGQQPDQAEPRLLIPGDRGSRLSGAPGQDIILKNRKNDKIIKYLLVFLLATGFVACSARTSAQILGGLYEKVDITPEPGMNLVGRVTDGTGPIEGVVVSDGVTVTTTDAQEHLPDAREAERPVRIRLRPRRIRNSGGERHAEDLQEDRHGRQRRRAAQLQARTHGQKKSVSSCWRWPTCRSAATTR